MQHLAYTCANNLRTRQNATARDRISNGFYLYRKTILFISFHWLDNPLPIHLLPESLVNKARMNNLNPVQIETSKIEFHNIFLPSIWVDTFLSGFHNKRLMIWLLQYNITNTFALPVGLIRKDERVIAQHSR